MNFEKRFAELPEYIPKCGSPTESTKNEHGLTRTHTVSSNDNPESQTKGQKPEEQISTANAGVAVVMGTRKQSNDSLDALAEAAVQGIEKVQVTSSNNGLKRNLDNKRNLVHQFFQKDGLFPSEKETNDFQMEHSDVFPSKSSLQIKIREVRQKWMQR